MQKEILLQFFLGTTTNALDYIEPREAPYGGHTECFRTFYECKDDSDQIS